MWSRAALPIRSAHENGPESPPGVDTEISPAQTTGTTRAHDDTASNQAFSQTNPRALIRASVEERCPSAARPEALASLVQGEQLFESAE